MRVAPDFRLFAYGIVALGTLLSFAGAVVPHFATGYRLHLGVLFAGLLPYVVYTIFTDVVRGWSLLVTGALLLAVDLAVKIPERFLRYDNYANNVIYYVPLAASAVIAIALGIAARRENRWQGAREITDESGKNKSKETPA